MTSVTVELTRNKDSREYCKNFKTNLVDNEVLQKIVIGGIKTKKKKGKDLVSFSLDFIFPKLAPFAGYIFGTGLIGGLVLGKWLIITGIMASLPLIICDLVRSFTFYKWAINKGLKKSNYGKNGGTWKIYNYDDLNKEVFKSGAI